jgi:hypothetical protein
MTDTAWRAAVPAKSAVGRLVLKTDAAITLPVTVHSFSDTWLNVQVGTALGLVTMHGPDWIFQVAIPPLPTTAGSSVWWHRGGVKSALILTANGWGNPDSAPKLGAIEDWTLIHDTGADK